MELGSIFIVMGDLASEGSMPLTISILSRNSLTELSISVPQLNITMTRELPFWDKDWISSILLTVETADSMGFVTSFSTSAGAAPSYVVITTATGSSMSGKRSTAKRGRENSPSKTIAIMSMEMARGRSIERSAIFN
jgi:hypothetical protein